MFFFYFLLFLDIRLLVPLLPVWTIGICTWVTALALYPVYSGPWGLVFFLCLASPFFLFTLTNLARPPVPGLFWPDRLLLFSSFLAPLTTCLGGFPVKKRCRAALLFSYC